jgi:hypothetical protein
LEEKTSGAFNGLEVHTKRASEYLPDDEWSLDRRFRSQKISVAVSRPDTKDSLSSVEEATLKKMKKTLEDLYNNKLSGGRYKGHMSHQKAAQDALRKIPELLNRLGIAEQCGPLWEGTRRGMHIGRQRARQEVKVESEEEKPNIKAEGGADEVKIKVESEEDVCFP